MDATGGNPEAALVPSGREPISYPCLRSLGKRGIRTILLSEHETLPQAQSRYCDEFHTTETPPEEIVAYRDTLLELARREDVRTILPTREHDIYVLSRYRSAFEEVVSVAVPDAETLTTVHDRLQLVAAAEEAGVPVPETALLSETDPREWDGIIKSRYNLLTGAYIEEYPAGRAEEAKTVYHLQRGGETDLAAVREELNHDPIVQEYVPSDGKYMFAGLYDHGEALATFQHRQLRGDSYIGGGGVYRESIYDPELERVARRLLSHVDWHGLACIEYIQDAETGAYKLLEINPRFWQSLPSTVHSDADFPFYYWQQSTGTGDEIQPAYEIGTGSHLLYGEVGYLRSLFTDSSPHETRPDIVPAVLDVLRTCCAEPRFDYLRLDDPRPFIDGLRTCFDR